MSRRLALSMCVVALACGVLVPPLRSDEPSPSPGAAGTAAATDDYELYKVFIDTLDQVQRNYVRDISRRELIEAAIAGVLSKLEDPYSNYINPQDLGQFKTSVESRFGGIGIQIEVSSGKLKVASPLVDTPAYRAGLQTGDVIVEIEGQATEGLDVEAAVGKLKGEPGSEVQIGVVRPPAADVRQVRLTREVIDLDTVLGDRRKPDDHWDFMLDAEQKIGFIRLTAFSRDTAGDLRAALAELTAAGLKGLVLDLRFNPGGLLSSAIEVSDLFVSQGRIVSTSGRNSAERVWDAERDGTFEGFPLVVLVNHYSASASEIVAACLQDHSRAVIIGERTWGKGSVQNVIELEGGRSALKLTTASYQRPSGQKIHRFPDDEEDDQWGVKPNDGFEVRLSRNEQVLLIENRRERDILRPHVPTPADEHASAAPATTEAADMSEPPATVEAVPMSDPPEKGDNPAVEPAPDAAGEAPEEGAPVQAVPEHSDEPASPAAPADAEPAADTAEESPKSRAPFVDRQLQKALEYLRLRIAKAS